MSPVKASRFPVDVEGRPPHLRLRPGELPSTVLLPGDPDRLELLAELWEEPTWLADRREYRVLKGRWRGVWLGAVSTGIGGPAAEIAVVELGYLGARQLLRVGGCGALSPHLRLGQLVINVASVRQEGASSAYAPLGYPAVSDPGWIRSMRQAGSELGELLYEGLGLSTNSYYAGQGRPCTPDGSPMQPELLRYWADRGISHAEMEAETILTVGRVLGLRCAALLAVHAQRVDDSWLDDYRPAERRLVVVASQAAAIMAGEGVSVGSRNED